MIDMTSLAAIEAALKASLGLECFHRACITTYEMSPPRKNGTALFEGQKYHVEGQATHDYLYFRHPTTNVLVMVEATGTALGVYNGDIRGNMGLEVVGHARQWVDPGQPRGVYTEHGTPVWENDTPDANHVTEKAPLMPHDFGHYGGCQNSDCLCNRKYEGGILSPEALVEVLEHIFQEHFDLQPITEGPFEDYPMTSLLPHYCWKATEEAFMGRFPMDKILDLSDHFYGGPPVRIRELRPPDKD